MYEYDTRELLLNLANRKNIGTLAKKNHLESLVSTGTLLFDVALGDEKPRTQFTKNQGHKFTSSSFLFPFTGSLFFLSLLQWSSHLSCWTNWQKKKETRRCIKDISNSLPVRSVNVVINVFRGRHFGHNVYLFFVSCSTATAIFWEGRVASSCCALPWVQLWDQRNQWRSTVERDPLERKKEYERTLKKLWF